MSHAFKTARVVAIEAPEIVADLILEEGLEGGAVVPQYDAPTFQKNSLLDMAHLGGVLPILSEEESAHWWEDHQRAEDRCTLTPGECVLAFEYVMYRSQDFDAEFGISTPGLVNYSIYGYLFQTPKRPFHLPPSVAEVTEDEVMF